MVKRITRRRPAGFGLKDGSQRGLKSGGARRNKTTGACRHPRIKAGR